MKKMKESKSGQYMPLEFAEEIIATLEEHEADPEFISGAVCILSYMACPPSSPMHGVEFGPFFENGMRNSDEEPPAEVMEAARKIIAQMEEAGIKVVDAYIVKGGN